MPQPSLSISRKFLNSFFLFFSLLHPCYNYLTPISPLQSYLLNRSMAFSNIANLEQFLSFPVVLNLNVYIGFLRNIWNNYFKARSWRKTNKQKARSCIKENLMMTIRLYVKFTPTCTALHNDQTEQSADRL